MEAEMILKILEHNARMEVKDLATVLQESVDDTEAAIKELENSGVICGYHTVVNWDRANDEKVLALIQINASPEREFGYDRIAQRIYKFDEVDSMYLLSGDYEFVAFVYGKTMQEVARFVASKLATLDGVKGTNTLFTLKAYKTAGVIFDKLKESEERLMVSP